jgi:uncharacterized protein (TIGR02145 family)
VFRYKNITSITIGKNVNIHKNAFDNEFFEVYTQEKLRAGTYIFHRAAGTIINKLVADKRDGKKFKTVKIGNQTWMAENLDYNAFGSKCYDNNPTNCEKYGRLYDWNTAMKSCPSGWHLPSKSEYEVLDKTVGGEKVAWSAWKKLNARSGWKGNGNGTDEFGFSALPGGHSTSSRGFDEVGVSGYWWSATEGFSYYAYYRIMYYGYSGFRRDSNETFLLSVRCIQD